MLPYLVNRSKKERKMDTSDVALFDIMLSESAMEKIDFGKVTATTTSSQSSGGTASFDLFLEPPLVYSG
jgi:hypothetical protein